MKHFLETCRADWRANEKVCVRELLVIGTYLYWIFWSVL